MLHRVFALITVVVLSSLCAFAGELSTDDISVLQEKAGKDAAVMVLPPNDYEVLGAEKAEEAYRIYQSEEFQEKIALERERIQKEVFGREAYYKDSRKGSASGGLGADERVYIFLSSSIPTDTLRRYTSAAGALGDHNVRFVMRGFIGGAKYVKPTLRFVKDLLLEDPGCDPLKKHVPDLRHLRDHRPHALRALSHHQGPRVRLCDREQSSWTLRRARASKVISIYARFTRSTGTSTSSTSLRPLKKRPTAPG